jgi:hypothetical protein
MLNYLALRDRRLQGGVPARSHLSIINTDATTPLATVFRQIKSVSQAVGMIHSMFILCHGYAGSNERRQVCTDAGGMGLQLARENVLHTNVDLWREIRNRVLNIVVYSCAAGDTQSGNEGTTADGRYLMGAMAIHTNATVYAADRIQWYGTFNNIPSGRFDFGAWEGQLWRFPSDGTRPIPVDRAPVEFADVMFGSAL